MEEKNKTLTGYGLRALGHCQKTEECTKDIYCNCSCPQCNKQDCFRPGCKKDKNNGCKKIHPYYY